MIYQKRMAAYSSEDEEGFATYESGEEEAIFGAVGDELDDYYYSTDLLDSAIAQSRRVVEKAEESLEAQNNAHKNMTSRDIISRQDREYQEALRIDRENARKAAEKAMQAAREAEELAMQLRQMQLQKDNLRAPKLKYPIEKYGARDLVILRFKLPSGDMVNHTFHKKEKYGKIIQQLQFDTKHLGGFKLVLPPRTVISCDENQEIKDCKFPNKALLIVTKL